MELGLLVTHLRTVRCDLLSEGKYSLADSVLKALAELEQVEHARQELHQREDCLGL